MNLEKLTAASNALTTLSNDLSEPGVTVGDLLAVKAALEKHIHDANNLLGGVIGRIEVPGFQEKLVHRQGQKSWWHKSTREDLMDKIPKLSTK